MKEMLNRLKVWEYEMRIYAKSGEVNRLIKARGGLHSYVGNLLELVSARIGYIRECSENDLEPEFVGDSDISRLELKLEVLKGWKNLSAPSSFFYKSLINRAKSNYHAKKGSR